MSKAVLLVVLSLSLEELTGAIILVMEEDKEAIHCNRAVEGSLVVGICARTAAVGSLEEFQQLESDYTTQYVKQLIRYCRMHSGI